MTTIESSIDLSAHLTLSAETLCAAFQRTASAHADAVALRTEGDGVVITWGDYAARVRRFAEGLHALGLRRGDTLALLLRNRPEFHLLDVAALHLGAVPFSIYATSAPEQMRFILRDAGARIAVTEQSLSDRLEAAGGVEHLVVVDDGDGLRELEERRSPDLDFDASWRAVDGDDLLTLIYTSGTTGPPKGVELTHDNLLGAWRGMHAAWRRPQEPGRLISYLPSAHIADRFSSHYLSLLFGHAITCCRDPREVARLLPEVRPTVFAGVPRIWQKMKAAVEPGLPAVPAVLEPEARAAILARLGLDRCEVAVCAAAPVPVEVLGFFIDLGLPLCELYGLSETSAVATANPMDAPRLGTVGTPVPGAELRLAEDGEILLRGPMVMRGYRNRPDKTVEAIDADGWLHTGDVGVLDDDGYLRIVDRKKELIINAAGKNMSPANIEAAIKGASSLISQACVIGDARPYNVALLTLDPEASAATAAQGGEAAVRAEVAAAVDRANARLSRVEQIKRYELLEDDWLPGGPELTPTMKLKRRAIAAGYAARIERLYA
jgi:long-subunit acyl-CoA synthetase (AMP-forming)